MSFSAEEVDRYARHLVLREIGGAGQQKLKAASVLVVGVGGLGGPAALYLAAAGVGRIGLIDADTVALSNLQRQVIFGAADVGRPKVKVAAQALRALNPEIAIDAHNARLTSRNAAPIDRYDLILDGTDDFETRLAVSDACLEHGKTLVSGAIGRWSGQVGVFAHQPCYRCLVREVPPDAETCEAVGVVGALAGVVGSMMALEAIKLITGAGEPLTGRLLIYDSLTAEARTVRVAPDPSCPSCGGAK
ncbi:MAG TPA: molybdopterin-synthase adenylyltransferase MoeB [Caulobacteraceae bacterium]